MSGATERGNEGLEIRVLGCLKVIRQGSPRPLPASRKTRGLLAYLALAARPCRREELCDLFWDDVADPRAELRWCLSRLRAALGPWLLSSPDGIGLVQKGLVIDALAFRRLASTICSEHEAREALALWRGKPLADADVPASHQFHVWWIAEQEALIEIHRKLLHDLVNRLWSSPAEALAAARQLVTQHPADEWGHARVSQALERVGRGAEARIYAEAARQALSRELDLPAASIMTKLPPAPCVPANLRHAEPIKPGGVTRPLLGVLPLHVLPDDESLQAMARHVTSELTGGLWRSDVCDVVECDGPTTPQEERSPTLTYAVRGSLVWLDEGVKLSLRCETSHNGAVLWFARFDSDGCIAPRIAGWIAGWIGRAVGAIHSSIQIAEINQARQQLQPQAHDLMLDAYALSGALEPDANRRALTLLREVLDGAPDEPRALALAAWCHAQRSVYNWTDDAAGDRNEAERFADAATVLSTNDPNNLTIIGTARCLVGDLTGARGLLCRALQLNPYSSWAQSRSGWLANYLDQPDRAIRSFRAAMQLAPLDPGTFNSMIGLGVAHFVKRQFRPAIDWMEKGLSLNPRAIWAYRNLVPAYIAAGKPAEAERGARAMLSVYPSLSLAAVARAMVFSRPTMARISDGLYRSGLPAV
jgi:DNA-binding SARP family transcriptional activator/tetratricopeptide (TPR) repeat protein